MHLWVPQYGRQKALQGESGLAEPLGKVEPRGNKGTILKWLSPTSPHPQPPRCREVISDGDSLFFYLQDTKANILTGFVWGRRTVHVLSLHITQGTPLGPHDCCRYSRELTISCHPFLQPLLTFFCAATDVDD